MIEFHEQSTTRRACSRLMALSICLCAFSALPVPQLSAVAWGESGEVEFPSEEDGEESSAEVLAFSFSRRSETRRDACRNRMHAVNDVRGRLICVPCRSLPVVGHQLANGLDAPLLI